MTEWIRSDGICVGMIDENNIYNVRRSSRHVVQTDRGPAFPISEDVIKKLRKKDIKRIKVAFGDKAIINYSFSKTKLFRGLKVKHWNKIQRCLLLKEGKIIK